MTTTIRGVGAVLLVALCGWCAAPAQALPLPIILFTADTASGSEVEQAEFEAVNGVPYSGVVSALGAPADSNGGHLPAISAGVTLSPDPAVLQGDVVGPLNGNIYGPTGFLDNVAGSTGWVTTSFTFAHSGWARLFWEVAHILDFANDSALAIDNVLLTNTLGETVFHFGFENGIPGDFSIAGVVGTSGDVPGLAAKEGNFFAFLDTIVPLDGDGWLDPTPPRFDTVDGVHAAQLASPFMFFNAGDTLSMDLAFLTSDGGSEFHDYAVAAMVPEPGSLALLMVPEPGTLALLMSGLLGLGQVRRGRRKLADEPPVPA